MVNWLAVIAILTQWIRNRRRLTAAEDRFITLHNSSLRFNEEWREVIGVEPAHFVLEFVAAVRSHLIESHFGFWLLLNVAFS